MLQTNGSPPPPELKLHPDPLQKRGMVMTNFHSKLLQHPFPHCCSSVSWRRCRVKGGGMIAGLRRLY